MNQLMESFNGMLQGIDELKDKRDKIINLKCVKESDNAIETMENVRKYVDQLESMISINEWPYPSYEQIWNSHC